MLLLMKVSATFVLFFFLSNFKPIWEKSVWKLKLCSFFPDNLNQHCTTFSNKILFKRSVLIRNKKKLFHAFFCLRVTQFVWLAQNWGFFGTYNEAVFSNIWSLEQQNFGLEFDTFQTCFKFQFNFRNKIQKIVGKILRNWILACQF